jgi:glycerol transport system ATP-binding protein
VLANLPDGRYRLGFRCDDVTLGGSASGAVGFPGTVSVTELSGSESFVHVDVGLGTWVCLIRGVHDWSPGAAVEVHVDMQRAFAFDNAGGLAAAPAMAESA